MPYDHYQSLCPIDDEPDDLCAITNDHTTHIIMILYPHYYYPAAACSEIHQLTSKDTLKEHCNGNTICTIAVMPDIGETGKNGREEYLTKYKDTVTKVNLQRAGRIR